MATAKQQDRVIVGKIVGFHGVAGWVKVYSHTAPKENIFTYTPWLVYLKGEWQTMALVGHRVQGKGLVAKFKLYDSREQCQELIGAEVAVYRSQMPKAAPDEYYWSDLIGLDVISTQGFAFGRVDHLIATGANDVLVVKGERERLLPFVQGQYVLEVNLDKGLITVDWDPEF